MHGSEIVLDSYFEHLRRIGWFTMYSILMEISNIYILINLHHNEVILAQYLLPAIPGTHLPTYLSLQKPE